MAFRFGVGFIFLAATASSFAQPERYDLGLRLKAFEQAWEAKGGDPAARKRALEPLKQSVAAYLIGQQSRVAGRAMDNARFALQSEQDPGTATRWAASLAVRPQARLIDRSTRELGVEVVQLYSPRDEAPQPVVARISLLSPAGSAVGVPIRIPGDKLPAAGKLPLDVKEPGDYSLVTEFLSGEKVLLAARQVISFVDQPANRLKKLDQIIDAYAEPRTSAVETLRSYREVLGILLEGKSLETDYPAAKMLAEAEALARAIDDRKHDYLKNRPGDSRLTLVMGNKSSAVRLFAPDGTTAGKPMPLVIALHGAGGSENLFFEGYGSGAIVKLCRERGWLLVSPRTEGFGFGMGMRPGRGRAQGLALNDLIDAVAELYPVIRERVFVVGHSMGAGQAVYAVSQVPTMFRAVAALGGGSSLRRPETIGPVPFFIGCGTEDFALSGARGLARSLEKNEGAKVMLKEYPDIEHLAIVQVALPDVFRFFDQWVK